MKGLWVNPQTWGNLCSCFAAFWRAAHAGSHAGPDPRRLEDKGPSTPLVGQGVGKVRPALLGESQ